MVVAVGKWEGFFLFIFFIAFSVATLRSMFDRCEGLQPFLLVLDWAEI